jgi:hypothetical protein
MALSISSLRGAIWVAAFIAALYAVSVYNSFFDTRVGYIYDPATDRLFQIELTRSINKCDKWTPLTPFKNCFFGDVGRVEYQGKLKAVEERYNLMKQNPKAWLENQQKEIDALLAGNSRTEFASWNITYHRTKQAPVSELLPRILYSLKDSATDQTADVVAIDAVIARDSLKADSVEIEVVRKALLIRGRAASKIAMGEFE